jgi:hypothetical protein
MAGIEEDHSNVAPAVPGAADPANVAPAVPDAGTPADPGPAPAAQGPTSVVEHDTAASPQQKQRPLDERLEEFWSLTLPAWLDDWFPQIAKAMADGVWTAAWRGVAAYAPVVAFAIGLLCRLIFRDINISFSESLPFMLLVIVGGILSGPVGVMLLAGYIVQDLLVGDKVGASTGVHASAPGILGGKLVSYLLLSVPAVTIPILGRLLADNIGLRFLTNPNSRLAGLMAVHAAIMGALVFLWSQAMLVLIRPLYTLAGSEPNDEAIRPAQEGWIWLVLAAALAAALRVYLAREYVHHAPRAHVATSLARRRSIGDKKGVLERVPEAVRVAIATTTVTLVLAGTYDGWLDALIVAVVTAVIGLWRANLIHRVPVPVSWALMVRRVPPIYRLLAAPVIGYVVSIVVLAPLTIVASGLRLVMFGSLITLVVFNALFPPLPVSTTKDQAPGISDQPLPATPTPES